MASDAHSAALLAGGSIALYTLIQNCLTHSQTNTGNHCFTVRQELSKVVLVQAMKENGGIAPYLKPQTSNLEVSGQLYAPSALPA